MALETKLEIGKEGVDVVQRTGGCLIWGIGWSRNRMKI